MDDMVVEVSIPLDDEGFLDRQCQAAVCGRYFKVLHADWEKAPANSVTCPFCGAVDEPGNFTTAEQQDFLQQTAVVIAQEKLQELLGGFARSVNRRQSRNSLVSINVTTKFSQIPVPVTPDALDAMRLQIRCERCDCTYAVIGAGFFCPLCGQNSARHTFRQAIAKARNAVDVARALGQRGEGRDAAAEARRDALENQINNLVTAFQRFGEAVYVDLPNAAAPAGRNLFQRLNEASKQWQDAGGRSFESVLDPVQWRELLKYFQQRHVLSHQDGFVDAEYIGKSGDSIYRAGQRLVITEAQVLRMADLVEKLGHAMQADLPEGQSAVPTALIRPAFPPKLPGVTDADWSVYQIVCEMAARVDADFVDGESVWQEAKSRGFDEEQVGDALEILQSKSLIKGSYVLDRWRIPTAITVLHRGLEVFFAHTMTEYQANRQRVAAAVLNGESSSCSIMAQTGLSALFVHYALKDFERHRWVDEIFWTGGCGYIVIAQEAQLKRFAGR